jgi:LPXTG-site transpeptidase (sortase) family protein
VTWRAVALAAVVAAGTTACSAAASVVTVAAGPGPAAISSPSPIPPVAPVGAEIAPSADTSVPGATAPPPAAPPTTTPAPAPTIPSHAAQLDQLPARAALEPVAVTAGDDAISGPVVPTGVNPSTGELDLPAEAKVVAWYRYGPAPGAPGSAVLAGHVDWHGVPGIFFRLRELHAGDAVSVAMSDGSVQSWTVTDVRLVAKPELPVADVFSRTGPPTLTLVTCGGSFDSRTHHYRSNVIVTAVPA